MQASKPQLKLVIGLGNPDTKYAKTYHNAGHLFIDYLKTYDLRPTTYDLVKSDVYMNESGRFVAKALKKHSIKPENLLIAHDDSDLEIGKYKLTFGQSAAGHHGVESIQTTLKTKGFWRLRIGIRPQKEAVRQKAEEFVLKKISAENQKLLLEVFQEVKTRLLQSN